jgi:hypothetical protein
VKAAHFLDGILPCACYNQGMKTTVRCGDHSRRLALATAIIAAAIFLSPGRGGVSVLAGPADDPKPAAPKTVPAKPAPAASAEAGESLFDGKTLTGWKVSDFAGKGEVKVKDGQILLEMGYMTGITRTSPVPKINYEISLEAMRVDGSDFFCGLTFPVKDDPCTLIVGGWGGGLVGLSSLDGQDASSNETTKFLSFENKKWYRIRLRVEPRRIQAWIDDDKVVDADISERKVSIRWEVEESKPLGIATWSTAAALRNLRLRKL